MSTKLFFSLLIYPSTSQVVPHVPTSPVSVPQTLPGWRLAGNIIRCPPMRSEVLRISIKRSETWLRDGRMMNFWANYSNRSPPVGLPPKWPQPLLNSGLGIIGICPDEYVLCEMGQFFLGILAHLLRMVLERKFYAEKVSNTPQASAENMSGCLGIWKLLFGWLI